MWYGIIKSEGIDSEKYKEGDTVIHHNQLGEKLRNLRKGKDLTQEQLAERLGVSFQAISKWENGTSYPDITMLPSLANFFGVTTDELLGVDILRADEKIEAYQKQMHALYNEWKLAEMVTLCRGACAEFPGNDTLRYNLAWALGQAQNVIRTKEENLTEAIQITESILETSKDTSLRLMATSQMVYFWHWLGNNENAMKYANMLPTLWQTRPFVVGRLGLKKGEEQLSYSRGLLDILFRFFMEIVEKMANVDFQDTENIMQPEEKIKLLEDLMQMLTIFYGEDLLGEHYPMLTYSYTLAALYASCGEREKAIDRLEDSLAHVKAFEAYAENAKYTSAMQKGRSALPFHHWSNGKKSGICDLYYELFDQKASQKYASLTGDVRFENLKKRVQEANGKD